MCVFNPTCSGRIVRPEFYIVNYYCYTYTRTRIIYVVLVHTINRHRNVQCINHAVPMGLKLSLGQWVEGVRGWRAEDFFLSFRLAVRQFHQECYAVLICTNDGGPGWSLLTYPLADDHLNRTH